jgi:hypothetical protein
VVALVAWGGRPWSDDLLAPPAGRLEAATIRHVRGELLTAGLADEPRSTRT